MHLKVISGTAKAEFNWPGASRSIPYGGNSAFSVACLLLPSLTSTIVVQRWSDLSPFQGAVDSWPGHGKHFGQIAD